jgi:dolichyl-phosphate-mannose-protein mannosyltransferase
MTGRAPVATSLSTPRAVAWLAGIIVAFLGLGLLHCVYLATWDDEWSYLTLGRLALQGHIGLFQDEVGGERLPLPYYLIGLSQVIAGPSLLAARVTSLGCGAVALVCAFLAARAVGGNAAALLAAAFLATHSVVVGYYAAASYFGFCAALVAAAVAAFVALPRPAGSLTCMACFTAVAFSRANLAVMAPAVLLYLLGTAATRRERLSLLAICGVPPVVFFLWSPEHLKILAYVPGLGSLVAPLGYRTGFSLGVGDVFVDRAGIGNLWWFVKRHAAWIAATVLLVGGIAVRWVRGARCPLPSSLGVIAALAIYTMTWQALILRMYPKSVAAWIAAFAPLWAIVLGCGLASLIDAERARSVLRASTAIGCASILALSPTVSRHSAMPRPLPVEGSAVHAYAVAAAAIREVVPPGERVFLLGNPVPAYLAGARLYLQQAAHSTTLVPSSDYYAASRSGLWTRPDLDRWLSVDAADALIEPAVVQHLRAVSAYAPLMARLEDLLSRHFVRVKTIGAMSTVPEQVLYTRAGGGRTVPR